MSVPPRPLPEPPVEDDRRMQQPGRRRPTRGALASRLSSYVLSPLAAAGLVLATAAPRAGAQQSAPRIVHCDGQIVREIQVASLPLLQGFAAGAWSRIQKISGRAHATTQRSIITSLMLLRVGQPCTELARAESERLLRAQPFIAAATVRAVADGADSVRIEVITHDEIPLVLGMRFHSTSLESFRVGDSNIGGGAIGVTLSGVRGHAFRDGGGIRITDFAAFKRPIVAAAAAIRRPLGSLLAFDIGRPYYTDLQRAAWHVDWSADDYYQAITRPAQDRLALAVRELRWDVGGVVRRTLLGHAAGIGLLVSGVRATPDSAGVVITDSGLVADSGTTLARRYALFRAVRPAVVAGVRMIHYVTGTGFNTLHAREDLPAGLELGLLVGRGLPAQGSNDFFFSGSLYAGRASPTSYLALEADAELRHDNDLHVWNDLVVSGRATWYLRENAAATFVLSNETAGASRPVIPLQLTLNSSVEGLRGYHDNVLAGAWRTVVRAEQRWRLHSPWRRADFGVAGFVDTGALWAGNAPYGTTTPFRTSVGASLLAAFPAGSKRLLRVDIAFPTSREGNGAWEVRFVATDLTLRFWREPTDIRRARTGPVPSSLISWPTR